MPATATIYAADHCAGDGVTDDGPGLNAAGAALVAAGGGRIILTPGRTYRVDTPVTIAAPGLPVEVEASGATLAAGSGVVSMLTITGALIQLAGGDAAYAAAAVGDRTIVTGHDLTGILSAGDRLMVWSDDVANGERPTEYLSGEDVVVMSVTPSTVSLDRPLRLAHTGAARRLYRLDMVRATITGGRYVAHPSGARQRLLTVAYAQGVSVTRPHLTGKTARYGLSLRQCVGGRIDAARVTDIWDSAEPSSPLGFGISIEGGVGLHVTRPLGERVGHVVDVGSFSTAHTPGLVSRDVTIEDGEGVHTWRPAFSAHHAERVAWVRCRAIDCAGGIITRATGATIRDFHMAGGHDTKPDEWESSRATLAAVMVGETDSLPVGEGPAGQDVVIDGLSVQSLPPGWRETRWVDKPGRVRISGPGTPGDSAVVVSDSAARVDGALGDPDCAYGARPVQGDWSWLQSSAGVVIKDGTFSRPSGSVAGCRLSSDVPADVEVSARWVALGTSAGMACMTARARASEADFYAVGVTGATGVLSIVKRVSGTISLLAASAAGVVAAGDLVSLRVVGRHLAALVNGRVVIEADDGSLTAPGRAGWFFRAPGGDGWAAAEFKVRDLTH